MLNKAIFFNRWKLGDLHSNKEYVRQFAKEFIKHGIEVAYFTDSPRNAVNLPYQYGTISELAPSLIYNPHSFYDESADILYINTWVGFDLSGETHNYTSQRYMWEKIAALVKDSTDGAIDIVLRDDTMSYVSDIDRDLIVVPDLAHDKPRVMFCNNIAESNQSFVGNLESVIDRLSINHPGIEFLCTNKVNVVRDNVKFTSDMIDSSETGCDLPEISCLSETCNVIVTNCSGPGTFVMTRRNFLDHSKTIVQFSNWPENVFWHNVEGVLAKTIWHNVVDDDAIFNILEEIIQVDGIVHKFTIIATDYEHWIPRDAMAAGIQSILDQTYKDYELLVIHDGPKEIPYEDEFNFSQFGDRVKFLNTPERMNNWGHSSRDLGLRNATGEYILHFNIDNYLYKDCLSILAQKIDKENVPVIIFTIKHFGHFQGRGEYPWTGLPPVWGRIDALQLVAKLSVWESIGYWHDLRKDSDGYLYEEITSKYTYDHIPQILAENHDSDTIGRKLNNGSSY